MRNAFAKHITQLAQKDERIVLLSGDIGNRLFDDFKAKCPDRFYNCGVAEANMIGVAAGLAMSGLRPVCYTIAPFLTYRTMEQIRVDLCYHQAPVVLVGTGAGLAYASLGATHHSCEEMGMLRLIPGMNVIAPADEFEVASILPAALQCPQPVYIRIGKKGEPKVHASAPAFEIGRSIPISSGTDVCFLACGTILPEAVAAAQKLTASGISSGVVSFPTLKPLDTPLLADVFQRYKLVVTVEEHSILGGLGTAVAEWLSAQKSPKASLLRLGTTDEFLHETCEQEEAREHFGLHAAGLEQSVRATLSN